MTQEMTPGTVPNRDIWNSPIVVGSECTNSKVLKQPLETGQDRCPGSNLTSLGSGLTPPPNRFSLQFRYSYNYIIGTGC